MLIKNTSQLDIIDYPFKMEKFSIKAGEEVNMRQDAAEYLLKVYGFLEKAEDNKSDKKVEKKVSVKDVVKAEEVQEVKEEVEEEAVDSNDYDSMSYKDLQKLYSEKSGNKSIGMKKDELVEALKSL